MSQNANRSSHRDSNVANEETKEAFVPLKGRLYQWVGDHWELVPPSEFSKVVISDAAMEAVKRVRGDVTRLLGERPDLSMVASAMLLAALDLSDVTERVRQHGARVFQPR